VILKESGIILDISNRSRCYDIKSNAVFNSAISISTDFLSALSAVRFSKFSHASNSEDIISFLSTQRSWYASIKEYVILVLPFLQPHVFAITLTGCSDSAMFMIPWNLHCINLSANNGYNSRERSICIKTHLLYWKFLGFAVSNCLLGNLPRLNLDCTLIPYICHWRIKSVCTHLQSS